MPQSVRITDEDYEILRLIKNKEKRTFSFILSKAIKNLAIAKKIDVWNLLKTRTQQELKNKAKGLVKGQS